MNSTSSPPPGLRRTIDFAQAAAADLPGLLHRQWLVANGLGGYASGTIAGAITWRYHGLLVAALPAPLGRTLMLNHLAEFIHFGDGRVVQIGGAEPAGPDEPPPPNYLTEFRLENHIPFWRYEIDGTVIEKRVLMPYLQNTVHVGFTLLTRDASCQLELRPSFQFRPFEGDVSVVPTFEYELCARGERYEIHSQEFYPPLRLLVDPHSSFTHKASPNREIFYQRDAERGYTANGTLWSPGSFFADLEPDSCVTLIASTEDWHTISALAPEDALLTEDARARRLLAIAEPGARQGLGAELVLAADTFIISPAGRVKDAARARAAGDELRSVIAGYHWFTDWGRDTMISLEGLTLSTGRFQEAAWILRTFAAYVRDGLIPNMFPEGKNEGLYHTADATLWFFHAINRYARVTGDRAMLHALLPLLQQIAEAHLQGTKFGIGVDPADGLLRQGAEGYQLTWMDAKVGDWVVTPRRGKAVEINALWYNALKLLEGWCGDFGFADRAATFGRHANRARESFNRRFWNPRLGCLFDVVDGEQGDDPAVRPNQLLAIALENPVLDRTHWEAVAGIVRKQLLTPVGLRSLSPDHKDYKAKYWGDLRARDAAYHQGTVWAWLIGPFIDAWLKIHPEDRMGARRFLDGFAAHLDEACVGSISEIFDAEAPYSPRGCIAQAWSVAEVLRCLVKTSD